MQTIHFLHHQSLKHHKKSTPTQPPKLPYTPKHHLILNLRSAFSGHPPQTPYILTSFAKHNSASAFYEGGRSYRYQYIYFLHFIDFCTLKFDFNIL